MKKEYSAPVFEIIEFDSVITNGSVIHDGTEVSCGCTSFEGYDFTNV